MKAFDVLRDVMVVIWIFLGITVVAEWGAYVVEKGRMKARKNLHVCDICFKKARAMTEAKVIYQDK